MGGVLVALVEDEMSGKAVFLVYTGADGWEVFDTVVEASERFDAIAREMADAAESDGEWEDDAEYSPTMYVAHPLREHSLEMVPLDDNEPDGPQCGEPRIAEYVDPVVALTAEVESLRALVAELSAKVLQ